MGLHDAERLELAQREMACAGDAKDRARTLRSMASNLLAVASQIENEYTASVQSAPVGRATVQVAVGTDKRALFDLAARDYGNRRARRRYFPAELFGEPAWDLLLDLFQARLDGKQISVTSACIGADVPLSTALRWIGVLEAEGLVERSRNLNDHRSSWVHLTDRAMAAMSEYFDGCMARSLRSDRLAEEGFSAILPDQAA